MNTDEPRWTQIMRAENENLRLLRQSLFGDQAFRPEKRRLAFSYPCSSVFICGLIESLAPTLSLLLIAQSLSGADLAKQPPWGSAASSPRKIEMKLLVTAANTPQAIKSLKLDERRAVEGIVCFFDTSDRALNASHFILRARQQTGQLGESTVKFRAAAD